MTEAIATDMLRSYIDRILRLKAEQDELAADIREIYAEAKGNGYDKTAIGNVVSYVRQRDKKGSDVVAEASAIFAIYLDVYDGTASRTHAHAREETEQRANVLSQREAGPGSTSRAVEQQRNTLGVTAGETAPHPTPASEPITPDAETPRAELREQPARGTIHDDEELPTWLRRGHPDCRYGAQGGG